MVTRRDAMKLLAGLALPAGMQATGGSGVVCRYRAKATVLMLSLPVFSRDGVGGGYLRVDERDDGGEKHIRLEFAAGSSPERAAGLSRLGMFEESVVESHGQFASASYFGFMTASSEQNLEQARAALERKQGGSVTAIRGRIDGGRIWNRLVRLSGLSRLHWASHRSLSGEIRERLESQPGQETEIAAAPGQTPCTFLYALRCAMRPESPVGERSFVHNGELLRLRTEHKANGAGPRVMTGRICHRTGKELSSFQVWFDATAEVPVPVKFEFRPRSFLRLSFEREAGERGAGS